MRKFVPHVESLEDRQLLATALFANGTNLTLTEGKRNEANIVQVYDFGTGVAVVSEHGFLGNFFGVTSITANLGGKNDIFAYYKLAPSSDAIPGLTVNVNLGDGNDLFFAALANTSIGIAGATTSAFNVDGGAGNDTLIFNQNATLQGGTGQTSIAAGSTLSVNLNGGSGNDVISAVFAGDNNGTLNMNIDGGAGNDTVIVFANAMPDLDFTPGVYNIRVSGGAGSDRINANAIEGGGAGTGNIDPTSTFVITRTDKDLIVTNNSALIAVQ